MKWIKRAVLGIFLAAAAVIGVLGFTKYQARQAEAKAAEETSRKKEQIKEIYTTEYQEAVKNGWKQQRNQERIQQRKCWWNKYAVSLCLFCNRRTGFCLLCCFCAR